MIKNIAIVSHKYLTQPDDDLVIFLNGKKYANVLHIRHSFSDATDRCSYYSLYQNGILVREYRSADYQKMPEALMYLKELFFTLKWIMFFGLRWDYYVGMDGLCVMFGNILRLFGFVKKTVYWAIDFVPENRFKSGLKNKIYKFINIQGYKKSDEVWDLSPRMAQAREKFLNLKNTDYRHRRIVPYGVWTDRIKKYKYGECEKNTLVFMGHLLEKQGAQLVIKCIPEIIKSIPDFRFKIIGDGKYKSDLITLTQSLGVEKYCEFLGKLDIRDLENEVARSAVAIAPYVKELDTWTYYADPGKVKTYLACGVPVLLTDIPWNAGEIEKAECGRIISEDKESIVTEILDFMKGSTNQVYRNNAIHYAQQFDYNKIFESVI